LKFQTRFVCQAYCTLKNNFFLIVHRWISPRAGLTINGWRTHLTVYVPRVLDMPNTVIVHPHFGCSAAECLQHLFMPTFEGLARTM
jgi:hypothetical protein